MNCSDFIRRGRFSPIALLDLLLIAHIVQPRLAEAQVETDGRVDVTLVGSTAENGDFRRLLAEWNSALEIHQVGHLNADDVLGRSSTRGQLRIWVILASAQNARLYFADASGERFLVREVPLLAGLDESGRETLAQVIATSARAFADKRVNSSPSEIAASFGAVEGRAKSSTAVANGPVEVARAMAPPGTGQVWIRGSVVPIETQRPRARGGAWQPRLGASYSAVLVSSAQFGHGPGTFTAAVRPYQAWRWLIAVQGQYRLPLDIDDADGTLSLRTWSVSAWSALERSLTNDWALGFDIGTSIQRTSFRFNTALGSTVTPRPTGFGYRPSVPLGLRSAHLLGLLRATALLGLDVALVRTHYDVGVRPAFRPWFAEPRCALELSW